MTDKQHYQTLRISELKGDRRSLFKLVSRLSARSVSAAILPDNTDVVNASNVAD